jgi:hypothetical protein
MIRNYQPLGLDCQIQAKGPDCRWFRFQSRRIWRSGESG